MFEEMIPITGFIIIFAIFKILSDNKVRRMAIEKDVVNENIKYLFADHFQGTFSSLKWGFVLIGIGIALLISQLLPHDVSRQATVGSMFFMAGLGLIIYYVVGNRLMKKDEK